jgi:glycosyltransferase involved in cell wall biosynthesis
VAIAGVAKARELGADARLRIVGPATTPHEERVRAALSEQIVRSGLDERVTIEGGVAPDLVPNLIADAHVLINTTVDGSADKTVFEAMAAGRPAIVSNPVFGSLLDTLPIELRFTAGDAGSLGARIASFASAQIDRELLALELRSRVVSGHSLSHWAMAVRDTVDELRRRG